MDAPTPQPDPLLQAQEQTALNQQAQAMQGEAASDTNSLMARYGTMLAIGGGATGASNVNIGNAMAMAMFGGNTAAGAAARGPSV